MAIEQASEGIEVGAASARKRRWSSLKPEDKLLVGYFVAVLVMYAVLSALGIHQSSMGIGTLQSDGSTSQDVFSGAPRDIRTDEYLRSTPLILGQQRDGSADFLTPLGADPTLAIGAVTGGVVERYLFIERTLAQAGSWLPARVVYAAYWWFFLVMALLAVPLLLRLWGLPLWLNLLATVGIIFNPAVFWWSFIPVQSLAPAAVVAVCIAASWRARGKWRWPLLLACVVIGAWALARLPFTYFPFAFPISLSLVLPTVALGLSRPAVRARTLWIGAAILLCGAGLALLFVFENSSALASFGGTEYPGTRRAAGELLNLGLVFGAPFLHLMQQSPTPPLNGTNPSEISTSWNVAGVAALIAAAAVRRRAGASDSWLYRTLVVITVFVFSWVLFDWPEAAASLPLLNLVPAFRMVAVIGIPAVLLLAVVLDRYSRVVDRSSGVVSPEQIAVAVGVGLVLLMAGTTLSQTMLPSLSTKTIMASTAVAVVSLSLLLAASRPARLAGVAIAVVGMVASVWGVNPWMRGLGDLVEGKEAQEVRSLAETAPADAPYWAADSASMNALLTANGVPTMSADQWTGPTDEWLVIDPDEEYRYSWNRGASMIVFEWNPAATAPVVSNPVGDVIQVEAAPCSPELAELGVGTIVSQAQLSGTCLTLAGQIEQGGKPYWIYRSAQ